MKKNKGFTLIEVLIAVTIIGILSTITAVSYKHYISLSNEAATKQEAMQLAQVFEVGCLNNDFTHSAETIEYESIKASYKQITGDELPFADTEISYSNNTLTLNKRNVTVSYDFNTKKFIESEE